MSHLVPLMVNIRCNLYGILLISALFLIHLRHDYSHCCSYYKRKMLRDMLCIIFAIMFIVICLTCKQGFISNDKQFKYTDSTKCAYMIYYLTRIGKISIQQALAIQSPFYFLKLQLYSSLLVISSILYKCILWIRLLRALNYYKHRHLNEWHKS